VTAVAAPEAFRQFYAEEIAVIGGIDSPRIVNAFASVPRERFLGPGPWSLCIGDGSGMQFKYRRTPDDHPRHVHHNVPIAIDEGRVLNNGQPSLLASWMQWLGISDGERVAHIGCGTGYFTAVLSEIVGPAGRVMAVEVDDALAAQATANLAPYPNVTAVNGDASDLSGPFEAIMVNAGATHARPEWLAALAEGGRLLLPLTFEGGPGAHGKGAVVKITRAGDRFAAAFGSMVAIYPCAGVRDPEMNIALQRGFMQWSHTKVRSVRTDMHEADASCWAHGAGFCLSMNQIT
jgi:protein-L-isoaspartate(D-aspartate) O-methyltransferase